MYVCVCACEEGDGEDAGILPDMDGWLHGRPCNVMQVTFLKRCLVPRPNSNLLLCTCYSRRYNSEDLLHTDWFRDGKGLNQPCQCRIVLQ